MLHEHLDRYLKAASALFAALKNCYIERYQEEILGSSRVNLRIRVRFPEGQLLEINEAVIVSDHELVHLDYRYHFQDGANQLLFRYDNTPHFPALSTFPHHRHLKNEVFPASKPSLANVLDEMEAFLHSTGD